MKKKTKVTSLLVAIALLATLGIAGIMAVLMDETDWVYNKIVVGNIAHGEEFTLTETTGDEYLAIPGVDITKDPVVEVDATNEKVDSYVFLRVAPASNWKFAEDKHTITMDIGDTEKALTTEVSSDWTYLCKDGEGQDLVYVKSLTAGEKFTSHVLKDDKIKVSGNILSSDVASITNQMNNSLNFKCYTIQQSLFPDPIDGYFAVRGVPIA